MFDSYRFYNENEKEREMALAYEKGRDLRIYREHAAETRGEENGIDKTNKLNRCLVKDNRLDDLKRSISDELFQKKLMIEYGIA